MNKQVIVYTDSYGNVKEDKKRQNPYFKSIHDYTEDGWRVTQMMGTGRSGTFERDGAFCFVLEKFIPAKP